ncbi:uncharacterized protein V1513DRAFT_448849 [Lipomyces chichibuensis]|uniref:uncharacterized protein n=1 Tax=Lipomyces chichibuensis TaxID=1546026 RepID=UPI003342EF82
MDPALTATLTTLLPSLSTIPPDLTRHATHLFLASKHSISLPARQEHARAYICAHIACVRLAPLLSLPEATNVHVPVTRRQYDALYKLFEEKLPAMKRHGEDKDRGALLKRDVVDNVCDAMQIVEAGLAKDGLACLWGEDGEKEAATVFVIRKVTGDDKRASLEWSVLGAVIFTVKFGDIIDHTYATPEQNGEEIEAENGEQHPKLQSTSTTSTPRKPNPPKARLLITKEHEIFKAKFLKLAFGRITPTILDNAIVELQTACFGSFRAAKKPYTELIQAWILHLRKALDGRTKSSSLQMDRGSRVKGISGIGRMVRGSVIYLTEKRRREYDVWLEATMQRLDVLERQEKQRRIDG